MNKSYLHLLFSRQTLAWYLIHGGFHAPESLPRGPGILTNMVHASYNWQCASDIAPCGLIFITLWKVLHVKVIKRSLPLLNKSIYLLAKFIVI